uniref:Ig-like domain-containing protein n=1 Tax=Angiostrongylus cantonensis TaxID=6313 RepID=A0A0K0D1F0_ANGCA
MANMAGDEVLLNCTISLGSDQAEGDVIWTRDGKAINLNNTDKYIWKVKRSAGVVVHTVRIRQATMEDDGDYACESRYQRASQIVHVNSATFESSILLRKNEKRMWM